MPLADLDGDLLFRILPHLGPTSQGLPIAVGAASAIPSAEFDGLLHRPPAGGLIIELERAGPSVDLSKQIASALGENSYRIFASGVVRRDRERCFRIAPATIG